MRFEALEGSDVRLIHLARHADQRGWFCRVWSADAFEEAGIAFTPVQANTSLTRGRGTLRGMHFQRAPHAEAKLVRCTRGCMHDVVVDLRPWSPRRGEVLAVELSETAGAMLYIPAGFAHGFQNLSDELTVEYVMDARHDPAQSDGFRHDDPAVGIRWPLPVTVISERDRAWPPLPMWAGLAEVRT